MSETRRGSPNAYVLFIRMKEIGKINNEYKNHILHVLDGFIESLKLTIIAV